MNYRLKQHFFLPLCCLVASLAILSGCSPVIWTPTWSHDSESFFYTQDDGSVSQYDLKSKSSQILFTLKDGKPTRVAISPDNKLIAVAKAKATKVKGWDFFSENAALKDLDVASKGHTIELTIVRLSDKKVLIQKTQAWGDPKASQIPQRTNAYWCPSGKRILICYYNEEADGPGFAVYDVESEKLVEMDTLMPETLMTWFLGVSPLVPDGSGYLAIEAEDKKEKKPGFVLVDWEGNQHIIENTPALEAFFLNFNEDRKKIFSRLSTAKWDKNVLTFLCAEGRIRIDLKNRRASIEPWQENQQVWFEKVPKSCTTALIAPFPNSALQLRFLCINEGESKKMVVELFDSQNHCQKVLPIKEAFPGPLSPDGKHMLVPLTQDNKEWLYVIRDDGTIVAKVKIDK